MNDPTEQPRPCCAPRSGRPAAAGTSPAPGADPAAAAAARARALPIPGGDALMGSEAPGGYPADGEGPVHPVRLAPFLMDAHAVTNAGFAEFARATGHVTDAERYGWSFVFGGLLPDDFPPTQGVASAPWWRQVHGADWRRPEGPGSGLAGRWDHPVVHVSWNDASAYCAWAGARLPTEAEWEHAARGGLVGEPFPWGADLEPGGEHRMNVFQGRFPAGNTCADGHAGTAPVGAFPSNAYGLHEMTGNVWEWVADWFDPGYYRVSPVGDPRGPHRGTRRVMRGGSYLCHASYCRRYRVDARSSSEPDSSAGNVGMRIALDTQHGSLTDGPSRCGGAPRG